mgnify:CR=1 FL=1
MRRVFIKTLGCKVNTFDSQVLEKKFSEEGYAIAASPEAADIQVINSCSVTSTAEKEARYLLRKMHRENPKALRIITGCYAQVDSAHIRSLEAVDILVPNEVKDNLVSVVSDHLAGKNVLSEKMPLGTKAVDQNKQGHFKSELTLFDRPSTDRIRAFLKVQDGCNGFCAYCLIPLARGASRSVDADLVLQKVKEIETSGALELVFAGIHLGDYGHDFAEDAPIRSLSALLERVLADTTLRRFRISSLEPSELSVELLETLAKRRDIFCDHFHLPLQSGSDKILKLMGRSYDSAGYRQAVALIRQYFPQAMISADVIPGFPGEDDKDFEDTLQFIKDCQIDSLHVFPYSKRPNTRALKMPNHVASEVIKERAARLRQLSKETKIAFAKSMFLTKARVLWESKDEATGRLIGKTTNYLDVVSRQGHDAALYTEETLELHGFSDEGRILAI